MDVATPIFKLLDECNGPRARAVGIHEINCQGNERGAVSFKERKKFFISRIVKQECETFDDKLYVEDACKNLQCMFVLKQKLGNEFPVRFEKDAMQIESNNSVRRSHSNPSVTGHS